MVTLSILDGTFAIASLAPNAPVPEWGLQGVFSQVCRTPDELSVVCEQRLVPAGIAVDGDWCCFKVHGPLNLAQVGVMSSLAVPLAEAKVALFAVSTYETDYLLTKKTQMAHAVKALRGAGHQVSDEW